MKWERGLMLIGVSAFLFGVKRMKRFQ